MLSEELAKTELKFKEQLKINESLKLQLAAEEDRYKVSVAVVDTPLQVCMWRLVFRLYLCVWLLNLSSPASDAIARPL